MAHTLINPQFSPIQFKQYSPAVDPPSFNDDVCNRADVCLPVMYEDDLSFQIVVMYSNEAERDAASGPSLYYEVDGEEYAGAGSFMETHEIGTRHKLFQWRGISNFDSLTEGMCWRFRIDDGGKLYRSNCFIKISTTGDDACYTSLIEYRNQENGFGFYYCYSSTAFEYYNRFRVAAYLSRPQFPETRKVFLKANGVSELLNTIIKKTYEFKTDRLNEALHESLRIALAHDVVKITNKDIDTYFVQESDYNIAWDESFNNDMALADTRLAVTPYAAVNSNCDTCAPLPCLIDISDGFYVDQFLYSGGTFYIDVTPALSIINCDNPIVSVEVFNSNLPPTQVSATIDENNIVTLVMDVFSEPGMEYLENTGIFTLTVTCADDEACTDSRLMQGTVTIDQCPQVTNLEILSSNSGSLVIQWDDQTPNPCGYQVAFYDNTNPADPTSIFFDDAVPGTATGYTFNAADGWDDSIDILVEVYTVCCDESFSDPATVEYTAPEEPTALAVEARYGPTEGSCCGGATDTVYILSSDIEIGTGVTVYLNLAMTITVPDGFIAQDGFEIYPISGGVCGTGTGTFC